MNSENSRRSFLRKLFFSAFGLFTSSFTAILFSQEKEHAAEKLSQSVETALSLPLDKQIARLRELEKIYGSEAVKKQAQVFVRDDMIKSWKKFAKEAGKNDLKTFVDILWNRLCKAEGIQFTISAEEGGKTKIHCTHCPAVAEYKKLNALDWGYELYCRSDEYMFDGFNPNLKFERTKTLMQGHDCCNHTYSYKTDSK